VKSVDVVFYVESVDAVESRGYCLLMNTTTQLSLRITDLDRRIAVLAPLANRTAKLHPDNCFDFAAVVEFCQADSMRLHLVAELEAEFARIAAAL
jgi:hypothetical protein